jgi:hypothetical protein
MPGILRLIKTSFNGFGFGPGNYLIFSQTGSMEKDFIKIQKESTRIAKKPTVNRSARLNVKN